MLAERGDRPVAVVGDLEARELIGRHRRPDPSDQVERRCELGWHRVGERGEHRDVGTGPGGSERCVEPCPARCRYRLTVDVDAIERRTAHDEQPRRVDRLQPAFRPAHEAPPTGGGPIPTTGPTTRIAASQAVFRFSSRGPSRSRHRLARLDSYECAASGRRRSRIIEPDLRARWRTMTQRGNRTDGGGGDRRPMPPAQGRFSTPAPGCVIWSGWPIADVPIRGCLDQFLESVF